jgi:serine/threonine-protein kinase
MGVVYRATDPTIGRTVALKTIRSELVGQAVGGSIGQLAERFRNEARAAGSLNHRNIVTIYDAGEHQGTFFIAMEYLEGTTLQKLIADRRSLRPEEVVRIGGQICEGLEFAHARGIVHRDIKPANIIITNDGTAKITDFGIAKAEQALTAQLTLTGQIVGTPDYMSPEQVKGILVDGRSDLFSLGVVLYQMSTGEKPFPGESVTTIIYKIVHETPIAPHALDASVPAGLSAVITRSLAKSPEARFPTARAMGDALRNYRDTIYTRDTATLEMPRLPQQPATVIDTAETMRTHKPGKSSRKRALVWSVLGLLIAAGALMVSPLQKRQHPPDSSMSFPNSSSSTNSSPPSSSAPASTAMPPSEQIPTPPTPAVPSFGDLTQQATKLGQEMTKGAMEEASRATQAGMAMMSGALSVTSTPSGASVSVDGKSEGWMTPVNIRPVSIGAHEVRLTKPGYQTLSVTAPVTPGSGGAVKATLMPEGRANPSSAEVSGVGRAQARPNKQTAATGTVVITSNPSGAKIVLEQWAEGKHTPARLTLPAGPHELVLMKDGYLPVTRAIDVRPSRVTEIRADLPRVPSGP